MNHGSITIRHEDFPSLFQAADRAAQEGKRNFNRATVIRLTFIILAAVSGMATTFSSNFAIITALAFVGALLVEIYLLGSTPESSWYDGQALAESTKSLTWCFAVGGAPFPINDRPEEEKVTQFKAELIKLLNDAPEASITPSPEYVLSASVRALRQQDLPTRKTVYLRDRIEDQQAWYTTKARANSRSASAFRILLLAFEAMGISVAIAMATGYLHIDLTGIIATIIGVGATWIGTRQYESLARAHKYASHDLAFIRVHLETIDDSEATWAQEVDDAEEAISREHTMWRASRSTIS